MLLLRQRFHSISSGDSNRQSTTLRTVGHGEGMVGTATGTGGPRSLQQPDMTSSSSQLQVVLPSSSPPTSALAPAPPAPNGGQALLRTHQGGHHHHHHHLHHHPPQQHQLPALVPSRFHQPSSAGSAPSAVQGGALVSRGHHPPRPPHHPHQHHGRHPHPYPHHHHHQHHGHRHPHGPLPGGGVLPFFIREIYKNGFLKRLPYNERRSSALAKLLRSDRYWVVFSVHDDTAPFLELWNEPTEVANRPPQLVFPLAICQHISPSLVPADNEWSFVVNFETAAAIRFSCNSRQSMEEWVDCLRMKLGEMGILNPKGNLYSKVPPPQQPLLHPNKGPPLQQQVLPDQQTGPNSSTAGPAVPSVRDPTSPLPQPPLSVVGPEVEVPPTGRPCHPAPGDSPAAALLMDDPLEDGVQVFRDTEDSSYTNGGVLHIRAAAQVHHQEQQQLQPRTRTSIVVNELDDVSHSCFTTSIYLGQTTPPKLLPMTSSSVLNCINDYNVAKDNEGGAFVPSSQKNSEQLVVVLPHHQPEESCCTGSSHEKESDAKVKGGKVTGGPSLSDDGACILPLQSSKVFMRNRRNTMTTMAASSGNRAISGPSAKHVTVIPVNNNNNHDNPNPMDQGNEENVPNILLQEQHQHEEDADQESYYDAIFELDEPGSAQFDQHYQLQQHQQQQQQHHCSIRNSRGAHHHPGEPGSMAINTTSKVPLAYSKSSPGLVQHSDCKKVQVHPPGGGISSSNKRTQQPQQANTNTLGSRRRQQSPPKSADSRQGEPLPPPPPPVFGPSSSSASDPYRGVQSLAPDALDTYRGGAPSTQAKAGEDLLLRKRHESRDNNEGNTSAGNTAESQRGCGSGSGAAHSIVSRRCSDRKSSNPAGNSSQPQPQQQQQQGIISRKSGAARSSSLGPLMDDHHESMMRTGGSGGTGTAPLSSNSSVNRLETMENSSSRSNLLMVQSRATNTNSLESIDSNPRQAVARCDQRRRWQDPSPLLLVRAPATAAAADPSSGMSGFPLLRGQGGGQAALRGGGGQPLALMPPHMGYPPHIPLPGMNCQTLQHLQGRIVGGGPPQPPPVTAAGNATSPPAAREPQVLRLCQEIMHPSGVRMVLRKRDCSQNSLALVEFFGAVWVAGWKHREFPVLYGAFHVGDQILSVSGNPIKTVSEFQKLMKATLAVSVSLGAGGGDPHPVQAHFRPRPQMQQLQQQQQQQQQLQQQQLQQPQNYSQPHLFNQQQHFVEVIVRRMPFAQVFHLKREVEGQPLGITLAGSTAEVKEIAPGSPASVAGMTAKIRSFNDSLTLVPWCITEVNGRPLNLFSKEGEAASRLCTVGKDISITLQPSDIVSKLRKNMRSLKGLKDYLFV